MQTLGDTTGNVALILTVGYERQTMIPEKFVTEYPARCMDLFALLEPAAREKQLLGSFSLIVATSVFMIPYERMKARHPLNRGGANSLYAAIRHAGAPTLSQRRVLVRKSGPSLALQPDHE